MAGAGKTTAMNIRPGTAEDAPRAFEIWRDAVKATHAFIRAEHMPAIVAIVETMVRELPLIIAEDEAGVPQGFMIFVDGEIDALFVDPAVHGQGFGSALLAEALLLDPQARVDASEQATNALPFYEARGFVRIGRSETDPDGRPYPTVHLRHPGPEGAVT
jgi:putative acetyltransferase